MVLLRLKHFLGVFVRIPAGALTGQIYADFIRNDLPDLLEDLPLDLHQNLWFQQDGCPAHWARQAREAVAEKFRDRWIGRLGPQEENGLGPNGPIPWPARCPDFSPLDFFLWGSVKDDVFKTRPEDPEELRERIRNSLNRIRPETLRKLNDECLARYQACILQNGGHFEHLLDG